MIWIFTYLLLSAAIYFLCRAKCLRNAVFKAPQSKTAFYVLSFTWGLPMTLAGCVAASAAMICGRKVKRYGRMWQIESKNAGWGLELGAFFIAPAGSAGTAEHEAGHGIQNIYLGIFMPAVVSIPSAIRFWYRKIRKKTGRPCKTGYNDIWFEKSASASGEEYIFGDWS